MTGQELGLLAAIGAVIWLAKPKKKKPEVFFVDIVDVWVPVEKKRMPRWAVNMAIVAGVVLLIWATNR